MPPVGIPVTVTAQMTKLKFCRLQLQQMSLLLYHTTLRALQETPYTFSSGKTVEDLSSIATAAQWLSQRSGEELQLQETIFTKFQDVVSTEYPEFAGYVDLGVQTLCTI
jgi:hypothetical protein